MKGSCSIKQVLLALAPKLSHQELKISEGGTVSTPFATMANGDFQQPRKDLLEYCEMDTYAMVEILRVLRDKVNS